MISTVDSEILMTVKDLKVYFEMEHYDHQSVRDVFVSALSHPLKFMFKNQELMVALDGIDFEVKKGTRLGVLGINGSGKTTLMRCIAGMMTPHGGEINMQGEVRAIFDTGTGVIPELTGRENAFLLARLFYPTEDDLASIVNEAIEFSELGHFVDIPFNKYSKGMQSRLLLSLISSRTTEILILDEVFDGADIFFQKKLATRMTEFIHRAGATIFVSHSFEQVRQICNEVMVLHKGKVIFHGSVEAGIKEYLKLETPAV